jgi:hypothetical protein
MKPHWLIENFVGDNGYEELIEEVKKQGFECTVLDIRNHFELETGIVKPKECVVFQGSIQMFDKLKKELGEQGCTPIGWVHDRNYLCSTYYSFYSHLLFNYPCTVCTVDELKEHKWGIYKQYGRDAMIFIRPDSGKKPFAGQLLDLQDFDKFWEQHSKVAVEDDDIVLVSTPKSIQGEWRYICSYDKKIIASSTYQYQGKRTYVPGAPQGATDVVNKVLDIMELHRVYPDRVFTVDICQDKDGDFWLLELNSFTSAGSYAANKEAIVREVSAIAEQQYNEVWT